MPLLLVCFLLFSSIFHRPTALPSRSTPPSFPEHDPGFFWLSHCLQQRFTLLIGKIVIFFNVKIKFYYFLLNESSFFIFLLNPSNFDFKIEETKVALFSNWKYQDLIQLRNDSGLFFLLKMLTGTFYAMIKIMYVLR